MIGNRANVAPVLPELSRFVVVMFSICIMMPVVDVRLTTFVNVCGLEYVPALNPKILDALPVMITEAVGVMVVVIRFVMLSYTNWIVPFIVFK